MRLATFNILHGRSLTDGAVDVERLATAVRELDADVLALQEVDRFRSRSSRADLLQVAVEAMGAREHRFVATVGRTLVPPTGEYGIALLSRFPVVSWYRLALPVRPWWLPLPSRGAGWRPRWRRDETRAVIAAVIDTPQGHLTVAATHLSVLPGWNKDQLRHVATWLDAVPRPLVLLGDLNLRDALPADLTGWTSLATAGTYPVASPLFQLDHALADGPVRALSDGRAIDTGVSDHRALVVDVALSER